MMDGKEFEVVADVVSLLLTPGPTIVTITAEEQLLGECENEEVEEARQKFATVRQELRNFRQQAFEVQRCLGMTLQRSSGSGGLLGDRGAQLQRGAELHAFTVAGDDIVGGAPAAAAAPAPGLDNDVSLTSSADLLPLMTAMRDHLAREALAAAPAGTPTRNTSSADAGHVQSSVYLSRSQPSSPGPTTPSHSRGTSGHHQQQKHHHVAAMYQHRRDSIDVHRDQLTLLFHWVQEQESTTAATYFSTKRTLRESKTAAGKEQVSRAASRVLIQLDRIVWQLCTIERTPFVQAALRGLTFDTHRNRDHSGSAKFTIHRIDIIDATGNLSEGPATPPGVILACWNPDASYEREPVLRVVTTMGVPTRTHTVFEHLDASLHPLSLHLTEQIAVTCWEYFFPKEDSKSRQEAFSQSVGSITGNAVGIGNANVGGGRGRRGSSVVATDAVATMNSLPGGAGGGASGESPMAGASNAYGTSPLASGRSAFSEQRGSPTAATVLNRDGGGGGGGGGGAQRFLLMGDSIPGEDGSNAAYGGFASGGSTPSAAGSSAAGSRAPFRGGGGGAGGSSGPATASAAGGGGGGRKDKQQQQQRQPSGRTRKRFVYVKLNRAHMRITYQGYPIGIKDRILVINSYTCENLDGRWRDLLANVKQKAILSAVWSGLGLQGRKIRELMHGAAPAVPNHQPGIPGEDNRGAKGLLARMGLTPKPRKGDGAVAGQPEMSHEELKALSKRRALFGNQMMKNMGGPLRSIMPASTTGGAAAAGAVKSGGGASAGASPSGSGMSSPRAAVSLAENKTVVSSLPPPGKTAKDSPPLATDDPPQSTEQVPSAQRQDPATTTNANTVSKSTTQQRHAAHAVPVLDLQRPLPPEDPADALGDHENREALLSPLEAGIAAFSTGNTSMATLVESPGRSSRSSTSSPTKKFSLGRANSNAIPGGNTTTQDPVTALLGQAFHQQQTQHGQHSPRHEEEAAAQLLGIPSPQKEGGGTVGGAGKTAKAWMAKMTGK